MDNANMQLDRLLREVTGSDETISKRAQYLKLSQMLNAYHSAESAPLATPKMVCKWFERESIPGEWLARIAVAGAVAGRPIDLVEYA